MKYQLKENHIMAGLIFEGTPIVINNTQRIWNDESQGQSYPEKDCIPLIEKNLTNN